MAAKGADGVVDFRYVYKRADGTEATYVRGEILHLRGLSADGIEGFSPIEALVAATRQGGELVGWDVGQVRAGYLADIAKTGKMHERNMPPPASISTRTTPARTPRYSTSSAPARLRWTWAST